MKTRLILSLLTLVGLCVTTAGGPPQDKFEMKDWEFRWTVAKHEEIRLSVVKDSERTVISLRTRMDSDTFSPHDAEEIAKILATTEDHFKKMRPATTAIDETLETEKYKISFHQSPENGFSIFIKEKTSFSSMLILDRQDVEAILPGMSQAVAMAEFVDKKINP
ncbi:hypothetical protein LLG95_12915 [bacterium]|nr:hypothetical protein [bacterium]